MAVAVQPEQHEQERVVIARAHHAGREYISVRKFWRAPDGSWQPSKLGVNLRADLFPADACAQLARALSADGDENTSS